MKKERGRKRRGGSTWGEGKRKERELVNMVSGEKEMKKGRKGEKEKEEREEKLRCEEGERKEKIESE